jgi:hypothetical protein
MSCIAARFPVMVADNHKMLVDPSGAGSGSDVR